MAEVVEGKLVDTFDEDDMEMMQNLTNDPEVQQFADMQRLQRFKKELNQTPSVPTTTIIPEKLQKQLQIDIVPLQKYIEDLQYSLTNPDLSVDQKQGIQRDIGFFKENIQQLKQSTKNMARAPFAPTTKIHAGKRTKKHKRSKTKRKRTNRITNRYRKYLLK